MLFIFFLVEEGTLAERLLCLSHFAGVVSGISTAEGSVMGKSFEPAMRERESKRQAQQKCAVFYGLNK